MDRNISHVALSIEEALDVLKPSSKDGIIVSEEVLSIKTANVDLMSGSCAYSIAS